MKRRAFIRNTGLFVFGGVAGLHGEGNLPFREICAGGSPGDIGFAHGRAAAGQIRFNLQFYRKWLSLSGKVPGNTIAEIASRFKSPLEKHFPHFVEEMEGIARGAGLNLNDILLINARTDIMALVDREHLRAKIPGCTSLALVDFRQDQPTVVLGQNWDWDTSMKDSPVILRIHPQGRPACTTLTEAGMLAKIGMNSKRLGVCLNFLSHESDGDPDDIGIPIHCLLRGVLECASIDEITAMLFAVPRCASANFMIARQTPKGAVVMDFEITPHNFSVLFPEKGSLIHTNHFLSPEWVPGCTIGRGPSTTGRLTTARKIVKINKNREISGAGLMKKVLTSRSNLPYPISRKGNPDPDSTTLAGVIMDLSRNRILITGGPPHENPWISSDGVKSKY